MKVKSLIFHIPYLVICIYSSLFLVSETIIVTISFEEERFSDSNNSLIFTIDEYRLKNKS